MRTTLLTGLILILSGTTALAQQYVISTVAGSGDHGFSGDGGPATNAGLNYPNGVAVDSLQNLYIADTANNRVRKVDTAGVITTVAGNGTKGFSGDCPYFDCPGTAPKASLTGPDDV